MTPADVTARIVEICRRHVAIHRAYLVQLFAPMSNQTTSPILALQLRGELDNRAFDAWPKSEEPLVVIQLNDDVWSRLIRQAKPIYDNVAHAIAVRVGGEVRELPSPDHTAQYAIEMPDGRMPILVREFTSGFGITILGAGYWLVRTPAERATAVDELAAQLPAAPAVSIVRTAYDRCRALAAAFGEPFTIAIPGVSDPTEMWIRGSVHEASSIGIFRDAAPGPDDSAIAIVREQRAAFARNSQLGEELEAIASRLAPLVARRVPGDWYVAIHGVTTHDGAKTASLRASADAAPAVALRVEGGAIFAHAGPPGSDGWDGELAPARLAEIAEAMAPAIERARG